jgi:hypothetical protein
MEEIKFSNHQRGSPNRDTSHHAHDPYWKRAHRDWRVWVGVVLMLAAMMIYLMTDDLAWGPHIQPQPPSSSAPAKQP